MRLPIHSDLQAQVGERLALRIGDVAYGVEVVESTAGTVTVELADSELLPVSTTPSGRLSP